MNTWKELAREYAALVPEWAHPGMRCVDPETGNGYRAVGEGDFFDEQNTCNVGWRGDGDEPECDRAIAAGPDLADNATCGALLLGLPKVRVSGALGPSWQEGWIVTCDNNMIQRCSESLAEVTIRVCIAQAKATVTP